MNLAAQVQISAAHSSHIYVAQEEASWFSEDEESMDDMGMDTDTGKADEAYIGMFLLKYVCPTDDCFGTMVPDGMNMYKCNMCGFQRTEEHFMAAVEQQ